jgi:hypothetical protein
MLFVFPENLGVGGLYLIGGFGFGFGFGFVPPFFPQDAQAIIVFLN